MKGLIALAIIGVVVVWALYYASGDFLSGDHGELIAFACGSIAGNPLEIQIVVDGSSVRRDGPRLHPQTREPLWDEWIEEHFIVKTKAGERIALARKHFGNLIPGGKSGTPDSYLIGKLPGAGDYTMEFVPIVTESKRYRTEFQVADDGRPYKREALQLVE